MADIAKLIRAKARIYREADELLSSEISKTERVIIGKIMSFLDQLPRSGGKVVQESSNFALLNQLEGDISRAISSSAYNSKVKSFLQNFNKLLKINIQLADEPLAKGFENQLQDDVKRLENEASEALIGKAAIKVGIIAVIKRVLFNGIVLGTVLDKLRERLTRAKLFTRHVKSESDRLVEADGLVVKKISEHLEHNAFRYIGSIIKTSRGFCRMMVSGPNPAEDAKGNPIDNIFQDIAIGRGVYLIEDIPKIIRRSRNLSGWDPDTDEVNFFQKRGGFNCRHIIYTFRIPPQELAEIKRKRLAAAS